ncbi:MAG: ribonuclease Y [Chloroflexi bacterium]|nr:ribonuclease Y [Chloroflexota bacterium]MCI0832564.1 ribonuclease Y [Chloroflexota bacterium]
MPAIALILGLVGVAIGVLGALFVQQYVRRNHVEAADRSAARILNEADRRQKELLREAKQEAVQTRREAESEIRERRNELKGGERRLSQKEDSLDRKLEGAEQRQRNLQEKEATLEEREQELAQLSEERRAELEKLSNLTAAEARQTLLDQVELEIRDESNRLVREIEQEVKEEADTRARKVIATTMQRLTSDVVSDATVSIVPLPSEDMKGRIIGREGRNIRAIEHATGVDVIIDDTPDAVTLSGFDPIRREIARIAMTKLLADGRIHPARIEEIVEKARKEVDHTIKEAGEDAMVEASCPGLHPEIVRTLGRLKFRYSYGQNQLNHAIETANLAAMIAHELGADVEVARRGGLLHDLGKAISHEVEGTHAQLGAELARRHKVPDAVVHCIEAHHEEVEPSTVEATITIIADAISGSRPGARRESMEHYLKRLEKLEEVANAFPGVDKSFAIQAGREIRIIVKPEEVDDLGAQRMAKEISKSIQESLDYPGQVKVTVIRERRSIEYAK